VTIGSVLQFIVGEIPFMLFMAFLVYLFWIRPKRKAERELTEPDNTIYQGDEVVFSDGMVGTYLRSSNGKIYVESGSKRNKYCLPEDRVLGNLSVERRKEAAWKSKSFWHM